MSTDAKTRKAIADRAIARAKSRGAPIDRDPAFVALLDEWVRGEIDLKEMRWRYLDILALQAAERHGRWKRRVEPARITSRSEPNEE